MKVLCGVLGTAGAASSCGYQLGFRTPESVRSIAVPIFNNKTFPLRRDVEYELTAALRREIQERTPLVLVPHEEADLVVHGTVMDFNEFLLAEGTRDQKVESSLRVTVALEIENLRDGTRSTRRVREVEPFSLARGESLAEARRRAIQNLAERLVFEMEAW